MIKGLRDKFLHSKEDVRKCFREHFAQAIREELEPCIQAKISNGYSFKVPPTPDFDERTFSHVDLVEAGLDYRIAARSRLDACKAVNPAKYAFTGPCMDKEYAGIYQKHCQAAQAAKAKAVSSSCSKRFGEVKTATCQCMVEKRDDWHTRFSKIQAIVQQTSAQTITSSQCGQQISDVVGAWLGKLQKAMSDCLPKDTTIGTANKEQSQNLRTLVDLGCGQVYNGSAKKNELTVGFRFIRLFLDALNDRLLVYCDSNCNF